MTSDIEFKSLIPDCLAPLLDRAMKMVSAELLRIDEPFVNKYEEIQQAERANIIHPAVVAGRMPNPRSRFNSEWTDLLEALWDFGIQADLSGYSRNQFLSFWMDSNDPSRGRDFEIRMRDWFIQTQSYVEQSIQVSKMLIRRSTLERPRKREIELEHIPKLEDAQERLEQFRDPWLHGAGGRGRDASGITEQRIWEVTVAVGQTPNTALPFLYGFKQDFANRWQSGFGELADVIDQRVCESLSGILSSLGVE
tara:strand:- start:97 stop:852 length:756 start_codon:yes stop_codon:yes gene_type:complete